MSHLDIPRLHNGLQLDYGMDATYISDISKTSSTYLLSPNGLPLNVGWFDNSKKADRRAKNTFAVTSYPEEVRSLHHRLMLTQASAYALGQLVEEDAAEYLEGYDSLPRLIKNETLTHEELNQAIRGFMVGSYVLTEAVGEAHQKFAWNNAYDSTMVREHGLAMIELGDVLAQVDDMALNRYADTEVPFLD